MILDTIIKVCKAVLVFPFYFHEIIGISEMSRIQIVFDVLMCKEVYVLKSIILL